MKDERSPVLIGVSSLLVIFSVLCLAVFAMLSISTVQTDKMLITRTVETVSARAAADAKAQTVLAVGRYTYQKSFDRLIRAWASADVPDGWKLRIVGDGEDREALSELAGELGVGGTVLLDGPSADMDAVYREASVLALSSRYEGLPMVLLEAQAYGIPSVAFDCQCGPSDVISDGESGLLVPQGDILGLAQALETLMSNEPLRRKMGAAALAESCRWDRDTVMKQWTSLFEDILSSRR